MRRQVASALEGTASARRDAEAEKERFKKVIQELKKKLDRWALSMPCGWMAPQIFHIAIHWHILLIAVLMLHDKFHIYTSIVHAPSYPDLLSMWALQTVLRV